MNNLNIPKTDSIEELARFWDNHDLTDYEDQLDEMTEAVFEQKTVLQIHLQINEARAINEMAKTRGLDDEELVRRWVIERIAA